jgi:hypothetical protein
MLAKIVSLYTSRCARGASTSRLPLVAQSHSYLDSRNTQHHRQHSCYSIRVNNLLIQVSRWNQNRNQLHTSNYLGPVKPVPILPTIHDPIKRLRQSFRVLPNIIHNSGVLHHVVNSRLRRCQWIHTYGLALQQ